MRINNLKLLAGLLLLLTVIPRASGSPQGSGSVATPPSVSGTDGDPFQVTKSLHGTIRAIDRNSGRLTVEDLKKKKSFELQLSKQVRILAKGPKRTIGDLATGQSVRLQYSGDAVLEIRILEEPKP